ncbi:unnamed protein product [Rotaria magnacalcarata]|uniref:Uncharacterized protein n=1 Tax=Rotaria magnacalcarata TaxID=392030 RepID=A0A820HQB5_9BILA|nr:unnamed protein product [Rotaria magnacalcarata]
MATPSQSSTNESISSSQYSIESISKSATSDTERETKAASTDDRNQSTLRDPRVLCRAEEKRIACLPCGHMAACGHSLRKCPISDIIEISNLLDDDDFSLQVDPLTVKESVTVASRTTTAAASTN